MKMKTKKRGEASLIAWVLLVGMAITVAGLVTGWAIRNAKRFQPEEIAGPELYCDNVAISLEENEGVKYIKNRGLLVIKDVYCIPESREPYPTETNLEPGKDMPNPCGTGGEIIPGVEDPGKEVVFCPMRRLKIE